MSWPFDPLPMFGFDVIMADPPWAFETWSEAGQGKSAQRHYDCMSTEEISRLPVGHLAAGDCWLWLWATHPMLADAMAVMSAWGFRFVTSGVWVKRGRSGKLAMGTGYTLRSCSELFLIGKNGEPGIADHGVRGVIEAPRRQHSRKPDEAYRIAERLFGSGTRRADLFSRQERSGWTAWGDETTKFEGADHEHALLDTGRRPGDASGGLDTGAGRPPESALA